MEMHMKYKTIRFVLIALLILSLVGCGAEGVETPLGHVHSYATETMTASCTEQGSIRYECACGHFYTEEISPLGHCYDDEVIAPTAMAQGYILHTCRNCGHSYQDAVTEAVYSHAVEDYLLPLTNYSREREQAPEFVMIHFTSAVVLSQKDPYDMDAVRSIFEDYELSVHYIIDRDGVIRCYIPESLVAWHAGSGTWKDDPKYTNKLNDYAIGIELLAIGSQADMKQYLTAEAYEGLDPSLIGYTDAQYDALKGLVQDICQRNGIPMDREHVIGHEDYSPKKTDPGELFDWDRLL